MGQGKLENIYIEKPNSRRDCFSKRTKGIFKKLYELAYLSGCGVHLIIEGEDANVYQFHRHMSPVTSALRNKVLQAGPRKASSKPINHHIYFNGLRMMDTGLVVTPKERDALCSSNCTCFDCLKGYSNRLFEAISELDPSAHPLDDDSRPFHEKSIFMGNEHNLNHNQANPQHQSNLLLDPKKKSPKENETYSQPQINNRNIVTDMYSRIDPKTDIDTMIPYNLVQPSAMNNPYTLMRHVDSGTSGMNIPYSLMQQTDDVFIPFVELPNNKNAVRDEQQMFNSTDLATYNFADLADSFLMDQGSFSSHSDDSKGNDNTPDTHSLKNALPSQEIYKKPKLTTGSDVKNNVYYSCFLNQPFNGYQIFNNNTCVKQRGAMTDKINHDHVYDYGSTMIDDLKSQLDNFQNQQPRNSPYGYQF